MVIAREDASNYKRVIIRDGKVAGVLLQGDISHAGIWQYLIKNQISVAGIKKDIFALNFSDFYGIKEKWRICLEFLKKGVDKVRIFWVYFVCLKTEISDRKKQ